MFDVEHFRPAVAAKGNRPVRAAFRPLVCQM